MLWRISALVFALWVIFPPFTQPLAFVLGPAFLLSESPRLGRLYASCSLFGTVSAAVSTVALIAVQQVDAWFFNFAELLTVCVVKAGLFVFANIHIGNIEAAWDMGSMDSSQADFLGCILASDDRQISMPSFDLCCGGSAPAARTPEREPAGRPLPSFSASGAAPTFTAFAPPSLAPGDGCLPVSGLRVRPSLHGTEEGGLPKGESPISFPSTDSTRHSRGRSWEPSTGSALVAEPSPF